MADWTWAYDGYDPEHEGLREALCTLGNGCFAIRGAAPECAADAFHYPGTYAAGCYNRLTSEVAGHRIENEDMVNLLNWLPVRFRLRDGPDTGWLTPDTHCLLDHHQELDLRSGILERTLRYETDGRRIAVRQLRLVHMAMPHLALLRTELSAEGWSGDIEVESAIDGTVTNSGVRRYQQLAGRHLADVRTGDVSLGTVRRRSGASEAGDHRVARPWIRPSAVGPHRPRHGVRSEGR
ncbi:hypothetical protein [Streptomyces brevispora]|uniref:hypothetical protein n=1 Tax=Streptomyces brevispora TaxID=887462 RepID=UPI0035DA5EEF